MLQGDQPATVAPCRQAKRGATRIVRHDRIEQSVAIRRGHAQLQRRPSSKKSPKFSIESVYDGQ
jgi:hypothetical protein